MGIFVKNSPVFQVPIFYTLSPPTPTIQLTTFWTIKILPSIRTKQLKINTTYFQLLTKQKISNFTLGTPHAKDLA